MPTSKKKRANQPSLDGPIAKMERASEHVQAFNEASAKWFNDNPYKYTPEIHAGGCEHVYKLDDPIPVVDIRIAAIIGDAIHNFRSGLDILVAELVRLNKGTVTTRTAYPMNRRNRVKGPVSRKACGVINRVYGLNQGRMAQLLLTLRDLDNIDKHRHLHVVGAVARDAALSVEFLRPGEEPTIDMSRTRLYPVVLDKRGQIVAKIVYHEPHPELDPHFRIEPVLAFARHGRPKSVWGVPVLSLLEPASYLFRYEAIPLFEPLFARHHV